MTVFAAFYLIVFVFFAPFLLGWLRLALLSLLDWSGSSVFYFSARHFVSSLFFLFSILVFHLFFGGV